MELRELTVDDWSALRDLRLHALRSELGLFFVHPDDEAKRSDEDWMTLARGDDAHQVFGLFEGERLVGMTGIFTDRDDPSGRTAGFGMTYLMPEFRGQGIAARLYETRLAWVRARPKFERVTVGHRRSNDASRRSIEKFGFRYVESIPHRWPDGSDEDDVCYELRLRPETDEGKQSAGEQDASMAVIGRSLAVVEGVATAFWVGASAGFAFVSAPVTAHQANDLDLQAKITGVSLARLANVTAVAGGIALGCAALRAALDADHRSNDLARLALGGVALGLVAFHQNTIVPRMTALQQAMGGSFRDVPSDDPNRIAYRAAHKESTRVFGGALLAGISQIGLGATR